MPTKPFQVDLNILFDGKQFIESILITTDTTPPDIVKVLVDQQVIPQDNFQIFIQDKEINRKVLNDEYLITLVPFNYQWFLRKQSKSIYLDLRMELCRTLPKEALNSRRKQLEGELNHKFDIIEQRAKILRDEVYNRMQQL
ncbi:hypothetical protein HDV06_003156 [Boothiomyces sp. JEL0866]|nr:hypothetical protein HDV06_003156 [Boothiomyces sp. JEL0866]